MQCNSINNTSAKLLNLMTQAKYGHQDRHFLSLKSENMKQLLSNDLLFDFVSLILKMFLSVLQQLKSLSR